MSYFLSKAQVISIVSEAIENREILLIEYQHTADGEIVNHKIAPFDFGTTNPKTYERNKDNVYAYSYTHIDKKTNRADPKVCPFNVNNFIKMTSTDGTFNENELSRLNQQQTHYDYKTCNFALLPNRNWFK